MEIALVQRIFRPFQEPERGVAALRPMEGDAEMAEKARKLRFSKF